MARPLPFGVLREGWILAAPTALGEGERCHWLPTEHERRNPRHGLKSVESSHHDEPRLLERRLLSPEQAAAYLGLRSRFAIYRLVASGRLRALRLSNKLRLDLRDLDTMIENAKAESTGRVDQPTAGPAAARLVPRQLAAHRRRGSVTPRVTAQARPN
jgi:excisionase family DNA binding protein